MGFLSALLLLLPLLASQTEASQRRRPNTAPIPTIPIIETVGLSTPVDSANNTLPPYSTWYYFDQLKDHNDPSLGTFKQRYYFTAERYQSGGPIVLMTPGESDATGFYGYLTNKSINGQIAQANNGATVVIEHRFYGLSNPYPDLTEQSLRLHTIEQAAADLVYFAKTASLPMTGGGAVHAPNEAPWILIGGSYSGALTSWTMYTYPDVFWSGYASSAVVEAIEYFWGYFEPIREYMPKNCSVDVIKVIEHIDTVFTSGDVSAQNALKAQFGMSAITHLDDVAGALRNPLWEWQSLSPSSGPGMKFFVFCDALEVINGVSASPAGWGLDHALVAWGNFMKSYLNIACKGTIDDKCLGSYDPTLSYYTNTTINNANRAWTWICCNDVGYWQDGAPTGWPSLVTRLVLPPYDNRQCNYFFPETFKTITSAHPNTAKTNGEFGGWDVNIDRLFFANGHRDPWREATVSAESHTRQSTDTQPIAISDGFHCSDLTTKNGNADPTVKAVQVLANQYFTKWHAEWHARNATGGFTSATTSMRIRRRMSEA